MACQPPPEPANGLDGLELRAAKPGGAGPLATAPFDDAMNAPLPLSLPSPAAAAVRVRLRAACPEDHAAVSALFALLKLRPPSLEAWTWSFFSNPARIALGTDAGWVLERGQQVVGFLGNVPIRCQIDSRSCWVATGTAPVVLEAHRQHEVRLLRALAAQPGAAFIFMSPVCKRVGQSLPGLAFKPAPEPARSSRLWWSGDLEAIWTTSLRSKGLGLLKPLAQGLARAAKARQGMQHERLLKRTQAFMVSRVQVDELNGTYPSSWPQRWDAWSERFWNQPGLWNDRRAAQIAWRLSDPLQRETLALWALHDNTGRMWGMVFARKTQAPRTQAVDVELLDWACDSSTPEDAQRLLFQTLRAWACSWQAVRLHASGFSGEGAEQLLKLGPQQGTGRALQNRVLDKRELSAVATLGEARWNLCAADHPQWLCDGTWTVVLR